MSEPGAAVLAALVTPWLLYAGLGAVCVPILIHLLARRRFRRVRWAAIDFLRQAQRENRRRMRIRELILLALRCLAVLLVGLLLARPFLQPSGLASLIGGDRQRQHLFVLDDSYSMAHSRGGESAFIRAVGGLRLNLRRLARSSSGDAAAVIRASAPRSAAFSVASLSDANLQSLLDGLDGLQPTQGRARWDEAADGVAGLLARAGGPVDAVIYLISDFQRPDWAPPDPPARFAPLRNLTEQGRTVHLVLIDVGTDSADNLTLSDLRADQRQVVTGLTVRLTAEVSNHTRAASEPGQIEVLVDDASRPGVPLPAIPPGQRVAVPFEVAFAETGTHTLHVALPPDGIECDNHRYLAVEVVPAVRVLLVDGEPAGDPYEDEVHLLQTALRPPGPVFSGIETSVIEDHGLARLRPDDLDAADLVILCNVYRPDAEAVEKLEQYVAAGGGLVVFVGDQVDADRYNELLYRNGAGLLPAALGEQVAVAPDRPGVTFALAEQDHPVLRVFAGEHPPGGGFTRGIHFWRYLTLMPPDGSAEPEVVQPAAGGAAATQPAGRGPAQVVLRFTDETGTPAWVERSIGRGRVVLLATACDNEWGDWPVSPSYVVTMLELAQYACRGGTWRESVTVGSPLSWPHRPDKQQGSATIRTPAYPVEADATVQAIVSGEGAEPAFVWKRTDRAGVYRLSVSLHGGGTAVTAAAVNVDPVEGDLTRVDRDRLLAMTAPLPAEYVSGPDTAAEQDERAGRELASFVLVAAAVLLMLELFLGWFFGRGG